MAAVWLGIGSFEGTQTVLTMHAQGMHHAWATLFAWQLLSWLPWALVTPWVMREARRANLAAGGNTAPQHLLRHLAAALLICLVASAWSAGLEHALDPWRPDAPAPAWLPAFRSTFLAHILASLILYAGIVITAVMLDSRERLARQRVAAAELAEQLSEARLRALRHQIEPHFLFNTLNAISGLVRTGDADAAADMIASLSEFLRAMLRDSERQEISLAEELDLTRRYLEIQRMRYGERLRYAERLQDGVASARLPMLILQPLVENAVKHGIDRQVHGGVIEIRAWREAERLCIGVHNDGPPLAPVTRAAGESVGLTNVKARLRTLYNDAGSFELRDAEGGDGVLALLQMPWQEAQHA
jgi:two-component sensor histidine kinase